MALTFRTFLLWVLLLPIVAGCAAPEATAPPAVIATGDFVHDYCQKSPEERAAFVKSRYKEIRATGLSVHICCPGDTSARCKRK